MSFDPFTEPRSETGEMHSERPAAVAAARAVPAITAVTDEGNLTALTHAGSHLRLWGVAAAGLTLDLWSKNWAFQEIGQGGTPRVVIPGVLEFQTMLNDGALFGMGRGFTGFFIIASILALGLVFWMFAQNSPRRRMLHIALGAILAGALGNMYDRITVKLIPGEVRTPAGRVMRFFEAGSDDGTTLTVHEYPRTRPGVTRLLTGEARDEARDPAGYVRDFIHIPAKFSWGKSVWPWVFNVADMLLVGGVGILSIYLWRDRKAPHPAGDHLPAADAPSN